MDPCIIFQTFLRLLKVFPSYLRKSSKIEVPDQLYMVNHYVVQLFSDDKLRQLSKWNVALKYYGSNCDDIKYLTL